MRRLEIGDRLIADGSWNFAEAIVESVTDTEAIAKGIRLYEGELRFPRDFEDFQRAIGHDHSGMGDQQYWYYVPQPGL
ncbi:hypothetical protein [Spirosoma foliorum]|uniref:Uncharacterized protein n=1 Tax=Spirosoma foliorum TaxID=2710596 RepID=A0A7G5H2L8_9BACT|nr:hypothetical protein [Spirosoma foliorum]QMW05360.1 hypothetical protein H3H32_10945 [Spirosoma foliorum]